ncbi:flavodoxin [Vibrio ruber]|uniref:flavodoxin n=1 Tax=Vibrio ruber TaxID=184755 RepID=UPI002892E189|nr:flavodoxin [Vibrio ruber]WNJ97648.1 flavodoxin [Vibrio ruber]
MNIAQIKNQWLSAQVDVAYPTPQSLIGRDLYLASVQQCTYQDVALPAVAELIAQDVYRVDFHRLTVMFAQLQAGQYQTPTEKEAIIEFFTQIIYAPPCELYLGFEQGEPVAAGILTQTEAGVLVSDLVIAKTSSAYETPLDFAYQILKYSQVNETAQVCSVELKK